MTTRQTVEFPDITDSLWPTRLVEQLLSGNLIDTGGVQFGIRFGLSSVTITNGTSKQSGNISHGLGRAPACALASAVVTADARDDYIATLGFADATTLRVNVRGGAAESFALPNPTTVTFYWVVLG